MDLVIELLQQSGLTNLTLGNLTMFAISGILIYLAITKGYEPLLLIPIGFAAMLANLPLAQMSSYDDGVIAIIYDAGIRTQLLPPLIFLGVGVLTDFRPLLARPLTFLLGGAAQVESSPPPFSRITRSASLSRRPPRLESSVARTGRRRSFSPSNSPPICSDRSRWPRTATCRWSPFCSRPYFVF
jgi:hypothetical protein